MQDPMASTSSQIPVFSPISHQTSQELLYHLNNSISPAAEEREAALAWLQSCQTLPGFHPCLIDIVAAKELPLQVRTQSILLFKNGIDRHWRRGAKDAIDPENKQAIRQKLLTLLDEGDRAIAKTLALCVGKLARLDYEKDWPNLFDDLLTSMQHAIHNIEQGHPQARLVLHRALLFFHQAVKALSQNRTIGGKFTMGRLCEKAFTILVGLYTSIYQSTISTLTTTHTLPEVPDPSQPLDLDLSLSTLKILGKLIVYGWGGAGEDAHRKADFTQQQTQFFISSMRDFEAIFNVRKQIISNSVNAAALQQQAAMQASPLITLNKYILAYGKMYHALLLQNHIIFHDLGRTRTLVGTYWTFIEDASTNLQTANLDDPATLYPLKFLMQYLLFIKFCFTQFPYADPSFKDEDFAINCTECILFRLMTLRQPDLEKWQEDPEDFIKEEEEEKWKFDIRPCAEAFLRELLKQYDALLPKLRLYLDHYENAQEFKDVLVKEAIYAAISHCSTEFSVATNEQGGPLLDFSWWLQTRLTPQGLDTNPQGVIIRRRIAAIAGNWISQDPSTEVQDKAYALLTHLLRDNASTDLAVRLTAAKGIAASDSWDMGVDVFLPYLETTLTELADILQKVEYPEIETKLNDILGDIIIRAGPKIKPHMNLLMEIIPRLWAAAETISSKQSVVATFKKLVDALGRDSQVLQPVIQQFVQGCCDPSSPFHEVLQDDGLDLWRSALRYSPGSPPELLNLARLAAQLMTQGTDILPRVLRILESYILLAPETFLPLLAGQILASVAELLRSLSDKATKPLLFTTDMLIISCPPSLWAPAMHDSGCFTQLLWLITDDASAPPITRYLPTLARMAIADIGAFNTLLHNAASTIGTARKVVVTYDDLAKRLLAQWLDRYDNLSYAGQRKLVALALANFVQTTNATILDRIDEIITVWLSALGETEESATGEYVHVIRNQNGPHLLQHADTREHPTSTRITGPPQVSASTLHITTFGPVHSPTVSTSSLEESAIVPCSQTSSSANSSYGTSQTSSPSTPLDNMVKSYDSIHGCGENYEKVLADWGPGVAALTMRKHDGDRSGSTCWDADATFRTDNATFAIPSPSIYDTTRTDDFDYANNDDTPVVNSTSHFSNNSIFEHNGTRYDGTLPADAGHGDDNDNHDNDNDNDDDDYYYYNMYQSKRSADCYYNNDEQDDELNLERGWEADGWGADPAAESKQVPEDARFKNLIARDPLHNQPLRDTISAALNNTANLNGGMQQFHNDYLMPPKVDANVLQQFQDWLSGVARAGD